MTEKHDANEQLEDREGPVSQWFLLSLVACVTQQVTSDK